MSDIALLAIEAGIPVINRLLTKKLNEKDKEKALELVTTMRDACDRVIPALQPTPKKRKPKKDTDA